MLFYFCVTQDPDGHWPQNMEVSGRPWWDGIQLDETAFVILLVGLARREKALEGRRGFPLADGAPRRFCYLVTHGPVTPLDRWEEECGYFASTLAVEIPALLVAADLAEEQGEKAMAVYLRETADAWNDSIESLIYVEGHGTGEEGRRGRLLRPLRQPRSDGAAGAGGRHRRLSKTTAPDKGTSSLPISSVPTRGPWFASACATPTTRAWSTPFASLT